MDNYAAFSYIAPPIMLNLSAVGAMALALLLDNYEEEKL